MSWLSNSGVLKKGGLNYWPPFCACFHLFFSSPSSLSLLSPLLLFTSFFHLHFLHSQTISSLENHFPRLLNLLSFISLNITSDLCVLDQLRNKPICLKPISKLPFFALSWHLPRGHLFLLSMGWNIIHPLNGMRKKGSFKTLKPMLHTPKRTSRWAHFCFFVGKFVDFMFCWELDGRTLSFCCCLFLLEFWTLYDLVGNHCVIMWFSLFWAIFELLKCLVWNLDNVDDLWNLAMYVTCGIVEWILTWILWVLKSWKFDV